VIVALLGIVAFGIEAFPAFVLKEK